MIAAPRYIGRNPKFTDDFEREMANDDTYHLGRDEPSRWKPLLLLLWKRIVGIAFSARLARSTKGRGVSSGCALLTTSRPWSSEGT